MKDLKKMAQDLKTGYKILQEALAEKKREVKEAEEALELLGPLVGQAVHTKAPAKITSPVQRPKHRSKAFHRRHRPWLGGLVEGLLTDQWQTLKAFRRHIRKAKHQIVPKSTIQGYLMKLVKAGVAEVIIRHGKGVESTYRRFQKNKDQGLTQFTHPRPVDGRVAAPDGVKLGIGAVR